MPRDVPDGSGSAIPRRSRSSRRASRPGSGAASSSRIVMIRSRPASRSVCPRNAVSSSDPRSAQCRSSMTRAIGRTAHRAASVSRTAPNRAARRASGDTLGSAGPPLSGAPLGRSGTRAVAVGASRSDRPSSARAVLSRRSASRYGANGRPAPPRSRHPPTRAMASTSAKAGSRKSSPTRRVLPMPASPVTRTATRWPWSARSKAARSPASSTSRPTRTGLRTRTSVLSPDVQASVTRRKIATAFCPPNPKPSMATVSTRAFRAVRGT